MRIIQKVIECAIIKTMINARDIMPHLIQACPSYKKQWTSHLRKYAGWSDDGPEDLHTPLIDGHYLLYPALGDFAHHLITLRYQVNQINEFEKVFSSVEVMLTEGDSEIQGAIIFGLLESIQNICLNNGHDYGDFESFLLPRTAKAWREVDNFWNDLQQT